MLEALLGGARSPPPFYAAAKKLPVLGACRSCGETLIRPSATFSPHGEKGNKADASRERRFRDYTVRDLNGYELVFGHHLLNAGPKLKIERVNVPVRLEKRLAALLRDLAGHKG